VQMSSMRVGLSSSNSNRPQAQNGVKGLKSTGVGKNTVAVQQGIGQVIQENRKPLLQPLSIPAFEGAITSTSSPLVFTENRSTQDAEKIDDGCQTSLSIPSVLSPLSIDVGELYEEEQTAEYYRQMHEALESSVHEARDRNLEAMRALEEQERKLNDSLHRLDDLRETLEEDGIDVDEIERGEEGEEEYTGEMYRQVYGEEE
ncbi:hypothetical protein PFISCL1PPCAC_10987, partial [Pristionchus fissidentatus]